MSERVFSGFQPKGNLHVGNYLAIIKNLVGSQSRAEHTFCILDLHAVEAPRKERATLKERVREAACLLFASGVDAGLTPVFAQSAVGAHAELAWILNCFIPFGWMQRASSFREAVQNRKEEVSAGLFNYPALMAADILLYETDLVLVGQDQRQYIELVRDVARRFNHACGETFKVPAPLIPAVGARVTELRDAARKMSKSRSQPSHVIYLLDSPDDIRSKVMKASTDSQGTIRFDETRPELYNLLTVYELFAALGRNEIEGRFEGKGYAEFKRDLAEVIVEGLRPLQARYRELARDPAGVDALLERGAARVRPVAEKTLARVKERVGLAG
ncbi:MAG: tryptophan--tRNA ligase [Pyrinomonadaceae bacterium]